MFAEDDQSNDSKLMTRDYLVEQDTEYEYGESLHLYKATIHLGEILFVKPKYSFPTGTKYFAKFFELPAFTININQCKSITYPMSIERMCFTTSNLLLQAIYGDQLIADGKIDLKEQLDEIIIGLQNIQKMPITNCITETLALVSNDSIMANAKVSIELVCQGEMEIKEVVEEKLPEVWNPPVKEEKPEPEYDEFETEINGHLLNVKVLKKKKVRKENIDFCDCEFPPLLTSKSSGFNQRNGVAVKGNQITFQVPSNLNLCNKGPQNVAYNGGTCMDGEKHGHCQDKVKILPGCAEDSNIEADGTFTMRLGKKSGGDGRFQVQLKAPRPVTAEDFKKPSRETGTQTTESSSKSKSKKKKK